MEITIPFEQSAEVKKFSTDADDNWYIEGFVSTSHPDLQEDIISQQALEEGARTLLESGELHWNHHDDECVGDVVATEVRNKGIWIKGVIRKSAAWLWKKIKQGIVNRFSIGGIAKAATKTFYEGRWYDLITGLILKEASLVSFAANPHSKLVRWFTSKSFDSIFKPTHNTFNRTAKILSSDGNVVHAQIEDVDAEIEEALIEALNLSPTICLNFDDNQPIAVIDEISSIGKNQVYIRVRYDEDLESMPSGSLDINGEIIRSEGGEFLGFQPAGNFMTEKQMLKEKTQEELLALLAEKDEELKKVNKAVEELAEQAKAKEEEEDPLKEEEALEGGEKADPIVAEPSSQASSPEKPEEGVQASMDLKAMMEGFSKQIVEGITAALAPILAANDTCDKADPPDDPPKKEEEEDMEANKLKSLLTGFRDEISKDMNGLKEEMQRSLAKRQGEGGDPDEINVGDDKKEVFKKAIFRNGLPPSLDRK